METDPYCPVCHAPTVIDEAHGFSARLGAMLMPHHRREVLDLRPGLAA